jgi:cytochrome b subunit of formate dehydrogenase
VTGGTMSGDVRPHVVRRFDRKTRMLHGALMVSFLGLAFTGLPLLFSGAPWARFVARAFGGFEAAGTFHRIFATVMIGVFMTHLGRIMQRLFVHKDLSILWGPNSMVPQPRDVRELIAHVRWFVGAGPRPAFEHFTYWEKFDYWAVFWGMGIIGGSGLVLWMPEFFAQLLPGWLFNVALLVHGEEALLAVGFIFTVHFFNGHIRPEKFPMDLVIFSGRVPIDELRHERPDEFARLQREGRLETTMMPDPPNWVLVAGRIAGTVAVVLGLTMVVLIVLAVLG